MKIHGGANKWRLLLLHYGARLVCVLSGPGVFMEPKMKNQEMKNPLNTTERGTSKNLE